MAIHEYRLIIDLGCYQSDITMTRSELVKILDNAMLEEIPFTLNFEVVERPNKAGNDTVYSHCAQLTIEEKDLPMWVILQRLSINEDSAKVFISGRETERYFVRSEDSTSELS